MTNAGHILIRSSLGVPAERHVHKCVFKWCRARFVEESNAVCRKVLAGTGLAHHDFPCMNHIADYRTRFGLDDLVDAVLDMEQARRFRREWTDAKVAAREQGEAQRNTELAETLKEPSNGR